LNGRLLRITLVLVAALATAALILFQPRFGQDPTYHDFADQRPLLGVPHFLNVLSNLPFLFVGIAGIRHIAKTQADRDVCRAGYLVLFIGVALTAFGSSYYHLHPTNDRLLWDRLPMAVAFMGLYAAIIAERIDVRAGLWLLPVLVAAGLASVLYWHFTEQAGHGDLRPYYLVQIVPMVTIPLMLLLFPSRYTRTSELFIVVGLYALAKAFEFRDSAIFAWGELISGHTLKHLFAALAAYVVLRMLQKRSVRPENELPVASAASVG
jgi:hypothetical protein